MKVSIVVAVYKKEPYLEATLTSILAQTHLNIEIILINDGSPDGCPAICEAFAHKDSRVLYISKENTGVVATRNLGFSKATGELIIPFDADDIMPTDFVEKLVAFAAVNHDAVVFAPGAVAIGQEEGVIQFSTLTLPGFLTRNAIPNSCAFRSSALPAVKGYRDNMKGGVEDWDFWLYFVELDMKIVRVPDAFYYYRVEHGSRNTMPSEKRWFLKKQIYLNHRELYKKYEPHPLVVNLYPLSKVLRVFGFTKEQLKLAKFLKTINRI